MTNPQSAYVDATVLTASPARLLVMLCDRLVLDVTRGLEAQRAHAFEEAHRQLLHAQEIVLELRTSLRVDAWDGGPALASLYDHLHTQLVRANVGRAPQITSDCLDLAAELAATWRDAALQAGMHTAPRAAAG